VSTSRNDDADAESRRGGAFYDDPDVFATYNEPREGISDPTAVMEEPAFLDELGPVEGLSIVDLGCGDASLGRELLDAGCRHYLGIDGSTNMVQAADANLRVGVGEIRRGDIEDFTAPHASFDVVVSRLALHYVEDIDPVLRACHDCLTPGGRIVFSVVHPVVTSHDARSTTNEKRADWVVDRYFYAGPREQRWLGGTVTWHHRTIEDYVCSLTDAGFRVSALRECAPRHDRFEDDQEFERRNRIPLFLLLSGSRD
jgi:SAM-dependent methyltransferase